MQPHENEIDIHSQNPWPSCALSNFYPHRFVVDGIECASMEGFLQSLKCDDTQHQAIICQLIGIEAKEAGQQFNDAWQSSQMLYWQGQSFNRESNTYYTVIQKAFQTLNEQSLEFREALLATKKLKLEHSIGENDPKKTVLTTNDFCKLLGRLRDTLKLEIKLKESDN